MKVTLIFPGIGGKGFDSIGQGMDSGWISHGLAVLGACARQRGYDVDLIDLRAKASGSGCHYGERRLQSGRAIS